MAAAGEPLTLEPAVLAGVQGEPVTYRASWSGLAPFSSYLGLIAYGETGASTAISVTTLEGAEPGAPVNTVAPSVSGEPHVGSRLVADPGEWDVEGLAFAYQWQRDGVDIAGETGKRYRVTKADQGAAISVVVTASKEGLPSASAASESVVIVVDSKTSLKLSTPIAFSFQKVTATVKVTTDVGAPQAGTVIVTVDGRKVAEVALDASDNGTVKTTLKKISRGFHYVQAEFVPADSSVAPSKSTKQLLWIVL